MRELRIYRWALRFLPREVRHRDGEEIAGTFELLLTECASRRSRWLLLTRSLSGLLQAALFDHIEELRGRRAIERDRRWRQARMGSWTQDAKYAVRTLTRTPAFTAGAVLLLALGVGAVTSIFTLVDHILLRPLPYPVADRLVYLDDGSHSGPFFQGLESTTSVDQWAGAVWEQSNLTGEGEPAALQVSTITKRYFSLFGARAALGRLLEPDDYEASDAVVISHGTWQRLFGGDEEIVGRRIQLDGEATTVVGVLDRSFSPPEALGSARADLWRPVDWERPELKEHGFWVMEIAGRLRDDANLVGAQAEVDALVARLEPESPEQYRDSEGQVRSIPVLPLREATVRGVRAGLGLLFGAVALLLVIACSNVAHLFLARGLSRGPELAVRRALGANTTSLVRQMLVECLVVALVGGALGVLLAHSVVRALVVAMPETLPREQAVTLDLRVVAFAVGLSMVTALFFGLAPALRSVSSSRAALGGRRRSTARQGFAGIRGGLVVGEVALSMMLLVGAGVLVRSFLEVNRQETGIVAEDVWVVPLSPTGLDGGDHYRQTMEPIREALAAIPGADTATYGLGLPFSFTGGGRCCWRTGYRYPQAEDPNARFPLFTHPVAQDYFATLGIELRRGRFWGPEEGRHQPYPAVLPESTAAEIFGASEKALGEVLQMGESTQVQVVGLMADVRHFGLDQELLPEVYLPIEVVPFGEPLGAMAVKFGGGTPTGVERMLRNAVWSVAPELPVPEVVSMTQQIDSSTSTRRFESVIFGAFGAVALLLAAGGLYGTLLYAVGQRRREMGIRLALGARRRQVEGVVLRGGLWVAAIGVGIGLAGSWMAARYLESRIWGVESRDPLALVAAASLLLLTAALASWLPARRASLTDPAETLRAE